MRGWLSGGFKRANPKSITLISKLSFSSVNNKFCKIQTRKLVSRDNVLGLGDTMYITLSISMLIRDSDTERGLMERVGELDDSVLLFSACLYYFNFTMSYETAFDCTTPLPVSEPLSTFFGWRLSSTPSTNLGTDQAHVPLLLA